MYFWSSVNAQVQSEPTKDDLDGEPSRGDRRE